MEVFRSAGEMSDRITSAKPYDQKEIIRSLIGVPVDWKLKFASILLDERKDSARVMFGDLDNLLVHVWVTVSLAEYPIFKHANADEKFLVKGLVEEASSYSFTLKNVEIIKVKETFENSRINKSLANKTLAREAAQEDQIRTSSLMLKLTEHPVISFIIILFLGYLIYLIFGIKVSDFT